ncbi:unnamed protein product [Mycena citricolor]|uniref:DUF6534 domain-containing protein n=1 Tax=Mycena citricolor TaxID=2018698 RepID=A0AAD2JVE4_9AGAR|nr:unnamed protein product [Mycena citricolor]
MAVVDVHLLFGPMLIGVFFNMILYGVLVGQMLTYYQLYRRDSWSMKALVYFLFFVETVNTGFDMAFMYQPLIAQYGEPPLKFPTFFVTEPLCIVRAHFISAQQQPVSSYGSRVQVAVSTPIQLFFAYRIQRLQKSWWIPLAIALLAFSSMAGGIWTAVGIRVFATFKNKPKLHNSALVWFLSSCVADVLITVSLVFSLARRKTGFSGTDTVIDKIIRMTIQTGMITALFSILDVVSFMVLPHAAVNFIWDLALSKLYTNCLMSTLNSRASLNDMSGTRNTSEPRIRPNYAGQSSPVSRRQHDTFNDIHTSSNGFELEVEKMKLRHVGVVVEHVKDPMPTHPHPYTQ